MPSGIVINAVEDIVAAILGVFDSSQREMAFLSSPSFLSLAGTLDTFQHAKQFIRNGGAIRGITSVSHANIDDARTRLAIREDLRHSDSLSEIFMLVGDKQHSISSINLGVREYTLDTPVVAFWSESPTYAAYLLASFENAWSQAVSAEERIQELLKQR
ncbi:MAG: hypothetical protein ACXV3D_03735 [Halobacteriota archaeon]